MAVCIAVIGKDNSPLYFHCQNPEKVQDSSFIVSSALDIIDERVQLQQPTKQSGGLVNQGPDAQGLTNNMSTSNNYINPMIVPPANAGAPTSRELYLGNLTEQEDYKVFGYMTNTKIKFMIIVEETSSIVSTIPLRENDIRMMFRKLHEAFCNLMQNPFYMPGTVIKSERFDKIVKTIISSGQT